MRAPRNCDVEQVLALPPARESPPGARHPASLVNPDRTAMLALTYLALRRTVGYAGALLPTVLILVEIAVLDGGFRVRGSLSAYYHSGARDFFVGTLCVVGLALITYLASERNTWQYVLSVVAGVAAFVVAFVPTRLPVGSPASMLTPVQQRLGEETAYAIHLGAATVFILALGVLCFLNASADRRIVRADPSSMAARVLAPNVAVHRACGATIFAAVGWVVLGTLTGTDVGVLTPLYLGEVVAVYAFATSWLVKAHSLARLLASPG